MKLTEKIKQSGFTTRFISQKSGIDYTHLTRVLKGGLELRPRTFAKLSFFAEKYIK